jgi:hypothetical protein
MKKLLIISAVIVLSMAAKAQTVGLLSNNPGELDGYVLFAPIQSDTTYLIDKCGKKIHQWSSPRKAGLSVYLLPDGSLLRTENKANPTFNTSGAAGGIIAKLDWNSSVLWSDTLSTATETQNHDVCPLPNGNIIMAVWKSYTSAQAIAQGRNPALVGATMWSAKLVEIQPSGTSGGTIVWQWNLFDHLVQDFNSSLPNYAVVADHPELMNINFIGTDSAHQVDWTHLNGLAYNPALDQVMFSFHNLSEIYIIDHSTTTSEAATHAGGAHGKGGDFLYRWGNPQAYNRGTSTDRKLYLQHNPTWIPTGYHNADKIMIFNNGVGRPGGNAASVDIIDQPVTASGDYTIATGIAYGPITTTWSYMNLVPTSFYTAVMGGAQRLSNGNTLICEATKGNFFEIDSLNNIVWNYKNPVGSTGPIAQGTTTTTTNGVFRCIYYPASYSGFSVHTLSPGNPIELNPLPYTCTMTVGIAETSSSNTETLTVKNPFTDRIIVNSNKDIFNANISIMDITGMQVYSSTGVDFHTNSTLELKLQNNLPAGIYFLNIRSAYLNYNAKLVHIKAN